METVQVDHKSDIYNSREEDAFLSHKCSSIWLELLQFISITHWAYELYGWMLNVFEFDHEDEPTDTHYNLGVMNQQIIS